MSEKKYVLLDFGHDEINKLLKKINDGMVLSKEQYQKLINEIGLENISVFDGDYNKLNNLPQIPTKVSELEFDIELEENEGMTEENVNALIQSAIENKADKEQLENMNNNMEDLLALKLDFKEGFSLVSDEEIERLAKVDNYDDFELKNEIEDLKEAGDEQKQDILAQVEDMLKNKIDVQPGKSLVDDAEIERLSKIDNFDDSELQLALRGKVDNEVIESVQDEINKLNEQIVKKVEAKEGFSLMSDEEIKRLAEVFNYDDTEVRDLLLDDEPYEMDFNNKHYVFACGHPVFAEAVNEDLVIKMGSTPEGMREIIVPKDLVSKTILVGGFGIKNINKSRHLASTYVHVRNAELLAVHGGNFFEGSVGKSVVIVENSKVREVIGGGDAGKQLEKRGAYKNVVGETEVILNEVTGCSLCYGGGGGHCSVGKARVYANNSNVAWIFPCGANGMTLDGELYLNSGTYNCVSQVNRGLVIDSKVFMNGGLAKNVYFGGETEDTTVDGILRNGLIVLNGGTVNNLNNGTSGGVELAEMIGYIRDCTIKAGDASNLVELNDRPENPEAGDFMFDVVLNKPIFFNGTHWVDSLGFIVG